MNEDAVIKRLREKVKELGTQDALAGAIGVTPMYISLVIRGKRPPSQKILDYLGLERSVAVIYEKKQN
jgi:transcriptional regulator with XRE-family HTH domain